MSGKDHLRRGFQKQLPNLLQVQDKKVLISLHIQDKKVQSQIIIRPGECGLAAAVNNRLMHVDVM